MENFIFCAMNVPFLHPLKSSDNQFSEVFKGYENGTLAWNELLNKIVFCEAIFFDMKGN